MRSFFTIEAEVFRKEYINSKSVTNATWETYLWYLKPLSLQDWIDESAFWKTFRYTTDIDNDIQEWDTLLIESDKYSVKWVAKKRGLEEIFYLQCLIVKW